MQFVIHYASLSVNMQICESVSKFVFSMQVYEAVCTVCQSECKFVSQYGGLSFSMHVFRSVQVCEAVSL